MRRNRPMRPGVSFPLEPNPGGWSAPPASSALIPSQSDLLPTASDESIQNLQVPIPFDYRAFNLTSGATGTTITLISQNQSDVCPRGMRGIVDGIFPYLEATSGAWTLPTLPAGVSYVWSVMINGRPDKAYGAISGVMAPWMTAMSERMLISLRTSEQITCTVAVTDANYLFLNVGIRIKGWFIPLKREGRAADR